MKDYFSKIIKDIIANPGSLLQSAILIIIVICSVFVTWWAFNLVIRKSEKKLRKRSFFSDNDAIFILIRRMGHYSIMIIAGLVFLKQLKTPIMEKCFYAFVIILLSSIINSIVQNIIPYLEETVSKKTKTFIDDVIIDLAKKFSAVIIYTAGIILAMDVIGMNVMPFVAGAGVAGIAIGFAAKDTLSNLIAGILLIIDRPFEIGDRIEVWSAPANSSTWGDVIDIGLRATKIRTTDNIIIVIPNNQIMTRDIINYTTITDEIRVRIPIGIAYDADVKKAKDIITKISLELPWVLKDPPPKVVVYNFGDSAVDLQARIWISEPRRRIDTVSYVMDRVKDVFQAEGIEIPYPKRDIYIK